MSEILPAQHKLLLDFLEQTNRPLFLTGKAGTGKTTLLRKIRELISKNYAVVAPTAVAAINAGGVTMHSLFQIPFGTLLPNNDNAKQNVRYSKDKRNLFSSLELLIIDEISMVRADVMDYIDRVLKNIKASKLPFGGVQVLMIGDLYQLSPVYHDAWHILKKVYQSPYFFDSHIFQQISPLTFNLEKVYRQSDPVFLDILNKVRENKMDAQTLGNLNQRFLSDRNPTEESNHVTLSTHNHLVQEINSKSLEQLGAEMFSFQAKIDGDFPADAYPIDEELKLKKGALVMFIKNDSSGKNQFYNGKTATITELSENSIKVKFLSDDLEIDIEREIWQHVKYTINETDNKISENNTGSFSQYPIKLAWAITIHKSQGLTFDKAIIDLGSAFAHGHAYVALSRCRSLDGLILDRPLKIENIITDPRVKDFTTKALTDKPTQTLLAQQSASYIWSLVRDLFDFRSIKEQWNTIDACKLSNAFENQKLRAAVDAVKPVIQNELIRIGEQFDRNELNKYAQTQASIKDEQVIGRIKKSTDYFLPKLQTVNTTLQQIKELNWYNDESSETLLDSLELCIKSVAIKIALLKIDWLNFTTQQFASLLNKENAAYRNKGNKNTASKSAIKELSNPALFKKLMDWRTNIALKRGIADHAIISEQALALISEKIPQNIEQLATIKGIGIGQAKDLGNGIMDVINNYLGKSTLF